MTMLKWLGAPGCLFILFVAIVLCIRLGQRIGRRMPLGEGEKEGLGALQGSVFGLMGLLIAFTFSGALGRWETRRDLVVQEANAIGTAYLRLDLLSSGERERIQEMFRDYLEKRLETYAHASEPEVVMALLKESQDMQSKIWKAALAASAAPGANADATKLLIPSLNEMIDITTTRFMMTRAHPPVVIYLLLLALALGSSILAGIDMARGAGRSRLYTIGFALITSLAIYVIIDLEFPRLGMIRIDAVDQVLRDTLEGMK